ncbi:MAG TPA: NAD(P)/FAD-dependent oxidoreductase [Burkholderiales bacterium]|nr:NAD(P)/FAD-dependent oxidoreductase [Burkholderiales bacterium]
MNALVIGDGVNELVCARLLARAGLEVRVLAGRARPRVDPDDQGWVPPALLRALGPAARGLTVRHPDPWATVPLASGGRLELFLDPARTAKAIRRVSPRDAQKWPEFCARLARLARLLERLYSAPPPDPAGGELRELARLAGLALGVRRLGRQGMQDLLRLLPMPVADWLEEWFECDALKGALAAAGVMDLHQGPRAGGTAFNLLHRHVGCPPGVFRPPRSNLRQVLEALPGIEIRREAQVARISVRAGRVVGAVLATGEEIAASLIVSGLDPRRTLLELVDPGWLDPEFARAVRHIRCRGAAARVVLALERAPAFRRLVVAPSLDYLERAHDEAKYGRVSQAPYLEAVDGDESPDGRQRLHVRAQYVPHALAPERWNEERRRALGAAVREALRRHAPELGEAAVERVLAPPDLEALHGWPEGQPQHAELALDQVLWMRPHPALARYRTPVAGLYLCGPAMHPGGDIAGAAGANAAREILRILRRGVLG